MALFSLAEISAGQRFRIDSLQQLLSRQGLGTRERAGLLLDLSQEYLSCDPSKALQTAKQAYVLGIQTNDAKISAESKLAIADAFVNKEYTDSAEVIYKDLILKSDTFADKRFLAKVYIHLSEIYNDKGNYDQAMRLLVKASRNAYQLNDNELIIASRYAIGVNYARQRDTEKSRKTFLEILPLLGKGSDERTSAKVYSALGAVLSYFDPDSSGFYLLKAAQIHQKLSNFKDLAVVYNNIGTLYIYQDKPAKARDFYKKSLSVSKFNFDASTHTAALAGIAASFNNEVLPTPKVTSHPKLDSALFYLDSAMAVAKKHRLANHILFLYEREVELYAAMHKYEYALKMALEGAKLKDSVFSVQKQTEIGKLSIALELQKKENESNLLQSSNQLKDIELRHRTIVIMCLACVLILLFALMMFYNRHKSLRAAKVRMEMQQRLARSQMDPHFIFNAITSIQNYILDKQPQVAYDYLAKFARLIRNVLSYSELKTLSLERELEMLGLYVQIEQLRFSQKFDYLTEVSDDVDPVSTNVPALILQPVVENAIWHGLMPLSPGKHGVIKVRIWRKDKYLVITIEDNGVGRKKAGEKGKEKHDRSMGLALIKERLYLLNHLPKGVRPLIIEDLYDENNTPSGTRVQLNIPFL